MKTEIRLTHDKVDYDKENEIHAVVTMTAPKTNWQKDRRPICVLPVIDVSGSMAGQKIEYAKKSIIKLVDHIQPGDYCGLVAFDSSVHSIAEPREMTQASKDDIKAKVGQLGAGSATNFAGGMRQALEWINDADLSEKYILRVIMFTDGHANAGEASGRDLLPLCKTLLGKVSLSAFGFGNGCDQELLADLAKEGKGNYAFIKNPDDALTAFGRELGGLLSVYAQNITIDMAPHNGHEITEVVSDIDADEDGKKVKVTVPEILSEEVRHIVYALKLSKQTKALPRAMNVLDATVTYDRVVDGKKTSHKETIKTKIKFVKSGEEQKEPTKDVIDIVGLAKIVEAQIQAEQFAAVGNYAGAQQAFAIAASGMVGIGANNPDQHVHVQNLSNKMSSRTVYATNSGYLRSSKKGLTRGVELYDVEAAADCNFVSSAMPMTNSAQGAVMDSFAVPDEDGTAKADEDGEPPDPVNSFGTNSAVFAGGVLNIAGPSSDTVAEKKSKSKSKKRSNRW